MALALIFSVVYVAQQLPNHDDLREACLLAYPVLAFWLAGCLVLWRWPAVQPATEGFSMSNRTAA